MKTSTNLKLNLPEESDYVDITVLNANFTKIDGLKPKIDIATMDTDGTLSDSD